MTLLSDTDLETYWREGYLLLRGLVDPAACAAVIADAAGVRLEKDFWTPRCFAPEEPDAEAGLHRLLVDRAIEAVARQLLRAPPRVLWGMLAVVPAGGGRGLPWHQDNQYALVQGRALNAFVALGAIPPERCTLWVAPGTHRRGIFPSTYEGGHHRTADPGNGVALPALEPGDACVFDRFLLHRSLTNQTAEHRYAYAAQFCEDLARDEQGRLLARWPLVADLAARWAAPRACAGARA